MDIKEKTEQTVSGLTAIYNNMLIDLKKTHEEIEQLKEQLEKLEIDFKSLEVITDCIKFKLDAEKKLLNKIYNNEDYEMINDFKFYPEMVKIEEVKKEREIKKCICGSTDLFKDDNGNYHCKACERL